MHKLQDIGYTRVGLIYTVDIATCIAIGDYTSFKYLILTFLTQQTFRIFCSQDTFMSFFSRSLVQLVHNIELLANFL